MGGGFAPNHVFLVGLFGTGREACGLRRDSGRALLGFGHLSPLGRGCAVIRKENRV